MNINDPNDLIDYLILRGALEPAGIDQTTGEITFNFTKKLKEVFPLLYDNFMSEYHLDIMTLWSEGFLDINITEPNPLVRLTPKALDKEAVNKLENNLRIQLEGIIEALRIQ